MENAEFFTVAQFRGVRFGQIPFGGDDENGNSWDSRDWHNRVEGHKNLFWSAEDI